MKIAVKDWNIPPNEIEMDPHARIIIGEGRTAITIMVRDGNIEISGGGCISIEPRAANVVRVVALP